MLRRSIVLTCLLIWSFVTQAAIVAAATVTFTSSGNGNITSGNGKTGTVDAKPVLTVDTATVTAVTAIPTPGYQFRNYSGQGFTTSGDNPLTITGITAPSIAAHFTATLDVFDSLVHGLSNVKDIKAGESHTVVLTNNGDMIAWGGGDGQSPPATVHGVSKIAAGPFQTLVIDSTGSVQAFGVWNPGGAVVVPASLKSGGVTAIAGAMAHSAAVVNGKVVVFGVDNTYGQLTVPTELDGETVIDVKAGHYHTVALTASGKIIAWGRRGEGQLSLPLAEAFLPGGPLTAYPLVTPITGVTVEARDIGDLSGVRVTTGLNLKSLDTKTFDTKTYHTVVLTADNKVICWGSDDYGESDVPANLAIGSDPSVKVSAIAAGGHFTLALLNDDTHDGTVTGWGDDLYGQLNPPAGLSEVTYITATSFQSFAIKSNLAAIGWGHDNSRQTAFPLTVFEAVPTNSVVCTPATDIVYGSNLACAVTPPAGGYGLATFLVNGVDIGAVTSQTPTLNKAPNVAIPSVKSFQSITALFAQVPSAPTIATVTPKNGEVDLTLTAPPDGGSAITGYTVTPSPAAAGSTDAAAPTDLTRKITGLANGTSYTFTATATNVVGTSAPSAPTAAVTTSASVQVTVDNTSATYDGTLKAASISTTPPLTPADYSVTYSYNGSSTAPTNAGTYDVVVTVTNPLYSGSGTGTFTINKADPSITWGNPADITYGTALGSNQLNATSPVPGGFTYNPPASTKLDAGSTQTLTATFTPTDTVNYNTVTKSVQINVAQAKQTITIGSLSNVLLGVTPFLVPATSDSPLTLVLTSLTPTVCTVANNTVSVIAVGTCTIAASQLGNTDYQAATTANTSFTVAPGGLDHFVFSAIATPQTAGGSFDLTITAQDAFNNTVSSFTGPANLTTTAGTIDPTSAAGFTAGVWTGKVALTGAGQGKTITVTDPATLKTTTSAPFDVNPGPAVAFSVVGPASTAVGSPFNVTITATDIYNNPATYYAGTVHFTSTDKNAAVVIPADYTFLPGDNGSHTFTAEQVLMTVGVQTIAATDTASGTLTGTSNSIAVIPAGAAKLLISAPASAGAGAPVDLTVTVNDIYGNTITDYAGTLHFTSSDTLAVLPADYTFVAADNGSHTFAAAATLKTSGSQTVSAGDTAINTVQGTSGSIAVAPAAASALSFGQPPTSSSAGLPFNPAVTVKVVDQFGNVVPDSSAAITVALASNPVSATVTGTAVQNAVAGIATFTDLSIGQIGSGYTLTATADGLTAAGESKPFDITVGALTRFAVTTAGTPVVGTPFAITVTAQDAAGNSIPDFTGTVDLSAAGGISITPAATTNFTAGVWSGEVTLAGAGDAVTITAIKTGGTESGTSNAFAVAKIAQTITVTQAAPSSSAMNATFPVAATSSSSLPVVITTSGVCTGSGSGSATITMTSATGTCSVLFNQAGSVDYLAASQVAATTTATAALPGAPTIGTISSLNGQASVSFTPPASNGGSAITGYTVTATPGNITATGTASPIVVTGLKNGTSYTFTVTATNVAGVGAASAASAAMMPEPNGDLNGDGTVDIRDAMLAMRVAVGLETQTAAMLARGDVAPLVGNTPKGDGKIDMGDAVVILRKIVKLVNF